MNKETMNTLSKMTELLNKLNLEGADSIIFSAASQESGSATRLIKGTEPAVVESLVSLIDAVFKETPSENKKIMKSFLINHILEK